MPILSDPNEESPELSKKIKEHDVRLIKLAQLAFASSEANRRALAVEALNPVDRAFSVIQRSMKSWNRDVKAKRRALSWIISRNKKAWGETKNPLYVYDTFLICRENHISIPKWVFEYLSDVMAHILGIGCGDGTRASDAVYKALGLNGSTGRGNYFSEFLASQENTDTLQSIDEYKRENPKVPLEKIFIKVGEETGRSWQVIRALYYKNRD